MSYMGPPFIGGGQIFPQQNQMPFQQLQQQIKAMQMHMQQQRNNTPMPNHHMQNQSNKKAENSNKDDKTPLSGPGGPSRPNPNLIQPNQPPKTNEAPNPSDAKESKPEQQPDHSNVTNSPIVNKNLNIKKELPSPKLPSLMGNPPPLMGQSPMDKQKNVKGPASPHLGGPNFNRHGPMDHAKQEGSGSNFNRPDIKHEGGSNFNRGGIDQKKQEDQGLYDRNHGNFDRNNQGFNDRNNQGFNDRNNQGFNDRNNYYENTNYYGNRNSGRVASSGMQSGRNDNSWGYQGQSRGGSYSKGYFGHDRIKDKLKAAFSDPLAELEPWDTSEKKFNVHSKLFIGNLPKNTTQEELELLFKKFGEISQVYVNKDASFAFINFDYRANASKAFKEMDNYSFKNRFLKVRFATISEGIRLKNLSLNVSNELLQKIFTVFGPVETCRVIVDERGMSKGEAIVIFREKKSAVQAFKKCQEECLFLSGALRPVIVLPLESGDENEEGLPEASLTKNEEYRNERNVAPFFAEDGSFEFDFGLQWKQLYHMYEEKKLNLERDFKIEIDRLEKKMVLARVEYETEKLRKELAAREADAAQLRRHFGDDPGTSQYAGSNYDDFGGKRPIDQGYEAGYSDPYDSHYGSGEFERGSYRGFDRGGYDRGGYDAPYDRNAGGNYDREPASYAHQGQISGGYDDVPNNERPLEQPPDRPAPLPPFDQTPVLDKPFERQPDRNYDPAYDRQGAGVVPPDTYKAPTKRPRY